MTVALFDVWTQDLIPLEIEDKLEVFYEQIKCSAIDIVYRSFEGRILNVVCDDEGLLKADPKVSAITPQGEVALVGNIIIAGPTDEDGNLTSLSVKDIFAIRKSLVWIKYDGVLRKVLMVRYA